VDRATSAARKCGRYVRNWGLNQVRAVAHSLPYVVKGAMEGHQGKKSKPSTRPVTKVQVARSSSRYLRKMGSLAISREVIQMHTCAQLQHLKHE
jgi:hypothetical protein